MLLHAAESEYQVRYAHASEQGRGLSSQLIRPFLDRADAEKVLVYTDTVTSRNVPFYEHFGFECMKSRSIEKTGITIHALLRTQH